MFSILGLLTGLAGPLASLASKIIDLQTAKEQAKTDRERMAYDQQIEEARDRRAVLIAEAGSRVNALIRGVIASFGAILIAKLWVYDKVIGAFAGCAGQAGQLVLECQTFRTDPLGTEQWYLLGAIFAFYFGYDIFARSRK